MVYSFPMDGQADISPKADIVLRFSHAIIDDEATLQNKITLQSNDQPQPFTVTLIDNGKSLKLEPANPLATGEEFTVTFSGTTKQASSNSYDFEIFATVTEWNSIPLNEPLPRENDSFVCQK